jgi:hypothetical protein
MRIAIAIYCGIVALFLVGVTLRAEIAKDVQASSLRKVVSTKHFQR